MSYLDHGRDTDEEAFTHKEWTARYTLTEYSQASKETRAVYEDYQRCTGAASVPVWLKSLGHNASLARAYWERAKGSLFAGSLPLALKELIVFLVSAGHSLHLEKAPHASLLPAPPTPAILMEKLYAEFSANLPTSYVKALEFAAIMVCDQQALRDEDFVLLREARFSRKEIGEIIGLVDLAIMFQVYTRTLQLDQDPNFRAIL